MQRQRPCISTTTRSSRERPIRAGVGRAMPRSERQRPLLGWAKTPAPLETWHARSRLLQQADRRVPPPMQNASPKRNPAKCYTPYYSSERTSRLCWSYCSQAEPRRASWPARSRTRAHEAPFHSGSAIAPPQHAFFAAISSASILSERHSSMRTDVPSAWQEGEARNETDLGRFLDLLARTSGSTRNGASGPVDKRSDEFDGNKSATSLEQLPPVPVRSTPGHRLDLEPFLGRAGPVGRIAALGDDAIEPVLLGLREQRSAIVEGLDQVQARDLRTADQSQ